MAPQERQDKLNFRGSDIFVRFPGVEVPPRGNVPVQNHPPVSQATSSSLVQRDTSANGQEAHAMGSNPFMNAGDPARQLGGGPLAPYGQANVLGSNPLGTLAHQASTMGGSPFTQPVQHSLPAYGFGQYGLQGTGYVQQGGFAPQQGHPPVYPYTYPYPYPYPCPPLPYPYGFNQPMVPYGYGYPQYPAVPMAPAFQAPLAATNPSSELNATGSRETRVDILVLFKKASPEEERILRALEHVSDFISGGCVEVPSTDGRLFAGCNSTSQDLRVALDKVMRENEVKPRELILEMIEECPGGRSSPCNGEALSNPESALPSRDRSGAGAIPRRKRSAVNYRGGRGGSVAHGAIRKRRRNRSGKGKQVKEEDE